jgi:hypothetical protein
MTDFPGEADQPDPAVGPPTPADRPGSVGAAASEVRPAPAPPAAGPAPVDQPGSAAADQVSPAPAPQAVGAAPGIPGFGAPTSDQIPPAPAPPQPGAASGFGADAATSGQAPSAVGPAPTTPNFGAPTYGYAPGYGPQSGFPPPAAPPRGAKAGPIVVGVIGLVTVLVVGVAVGFLVSGGSSTQAVPTSIPAAPSQVPTTTSAPQSSAPPGRYSMAAITNACDLLDPTPLAKWSTKPAAPVHQELPPDGGYGGALTCRLNYTSTSPTDGVTTDQAGIGVSAEFTSAGEPPGYDRWNAAVQPGWSKGTIPALGARNYWLGIAGTAQSPGGSYIVRVQDSNVSVEVQVAVLRAHGEDPAKLDDLAAIAQSQVRTVLDRLKRP